MSSDIISGVIIDHNAVIPLVELARCCSVPVEFIEDLVEEGILDPLEINTEHWCFRGNCVQRVRISIRLQHDLGVNLPGVAIILDLLDARSAHPSSFVLF